MSANCPNCNRKLLGSLEVPERIFEEEEFDDEGRFLGMREVVETHVVEPGGNVVVCSGCNAAVALEDNEGNPHPDLDAIRKEGAERRASEEEKRLERERKQEERLAAKAEKLAEKEAPEPPESGGVAPPVQKS